jgi:outer membrane protein OmpA-like peptidoglycan-associated protein
MPEPEPEPEPEPPPPPPPPAPVDSDGDGLFDPDDKCPDKPEDKDGFDDGDGCPDDDNDKDTVLDMNDPCRDEPGPVENKGCPDKDRDGDTVVDRLDNCPDEPGPPENQGCKQKQLVVVTTGSLDILDTIHFDTDKARIKQKSFKLLDNIAAVIRSHSEIRKIQVIGHTDSKADDAFNQGLSERRAAAVVEYLVGKGVERERLEPVGKGESEPIADNDSEKGRAKNRRVEFKIIDSGPSGGGTPPAPPAGGGPKPMDD